MWEVVIVGWFYVVLFGKRIVVRIGMVDVFGYVLDVVGYFFVVYFIYKGED